MFEFTYRIPPKLEDEYSEKLISIGVTTFCFEKISGTLFIKIYSDSPDQIKGVCKDYLLNVSEIHENDWKNKCTDGYNGHELTENKYVLSPGIMPPQKNTDFLIKKDRSKRYIW